MAIDSTDLGGLDWDPFGGAPDPYFIIYVDEQEVFSSNFVNDEFFPEWTDQGPDILISEPVRVAVEVWDSDNGIDDLIESFEFDPIPQEALNAGLIQVDGDSVSFVFSFELSQ